MGIADATAICPVSRLKPYRKGRSGQGFGTLGSGALNPVEDPELLQKILLPDGR